MIGKIKDKVNLLQIKSLSSCLNKGACAKSMARMIKQFFQGCRDENENGNFEVVFNLLINTASFLDRHGLEDVSIEIYKKIKFYNKVRECTKIMAKRIKDKSAVS